jgi:hypothetical protein
MLAKMPENWRELLLGRQIGGMLGTDDPGLRQRIDRQNGLYAVPLGELITR